MNSGFTREILSNTPLVARQEKIKGMIRSYVVSVLAVVLLVSDTTSGAEIIASTPYGQVLGSLDQDILAFRGIPFAAPPVGNLRFKHAEPVSPWHGKPLNATKFAPGCIQQCTNPKPLFSCPLTVSEDCLYLNIFTPTVSSNMSASLPVLFYMHGGNYVDGSGGTPIYDGGDVARRQNVVVVTINYRLGVFGALYTGTVRGNFHLSDQIEALVFVSKIIPSFGGDPNLVTITGQSAGAASVAALLSSPPAWPYFHRAIVVSNPFGILASPPERAIKLGEAVLAQLNCSLGGGELELQCLRNASLSSLMAATGVNYPVGGSNYLLMMMQWTPVVDGEFLPFQPIYALSTGQFNKVPIMMGTCANESVPWIYGILNEPSPMETCDGFILFVFGLETGMKVLDFYGDPPAGEEKDARPFLSEGTTDYIFYCSTRFVLDAVSSHVPTFMYIFDYVPSFQEWIYGPGSVCDDLVCHQTDVPFIFYPIDAPHPSGVQLPNLTQGEKDLGHFIGQVWGNFARGGDPNPVPNITYPRYSPASPGYVNYSVPVSAVKSYRNRECAFWNSVGYERYG